MKKLILAVIAAANFTAAGNAGEFGLETMSVSELEAAGQSLQAAPVPVEPELLGMDKSPNLPSPFLDLTVKLPFSSLSTRLKELPGIKMQPINPGAPILFKQADHIAFTNVAVDYNGIEVEPTLLIRPAF